MTKISKIIKLTLSSPYSWAALLVTLVFEILFIEWFNPSFYVSGISLIFCLFFVFIWIVIFLRSDGFKNKYYGITSPGKPDSIEQLLKSCHPEFKQAALLCLTMAEKIKDEFKSESFTGEVNNLLSNLEVLTLNHKELYERSKEFGTEIQKTKMKKMIKDQTDSVNNSLIALKKFSGMLTLFDYKMKDMTEIDGELKAVNTGLQQVIKEYQDE